MSTVVRKAFSNRPIWLAGAACLAMAWPPTFDRMAGPCPWGSASFTSSQPPPRPKVDRREEFDRAEMAVLQDLGAHQTLPGPTGWPEGAVESPQTREPSVRPQLRAVELAHHPCSESDPQNPGVAFSHRVSHPIPPPPNDDTMKPVSQSHRHVTRTWLDLGEWRTRGAGSAPRSRRCRVRIQPHALAWNPASFMLTLSWPMAVHATALRSGRGT